MRSSVLFFAGMTIILCCSLALAGEAKDGDLEMKVFTVNHGNPSEIEKVINDMKSPEGRVSVYEATNKVIVYDHPGNLQQIEKIIEQIDVAQKQVSIKVIVTECVDLEKNDLGFVLGRQIIGAEEFHKVSYVLNKSTNLNRRSEMSVRTISGNPAILRVGQEEIYPGTVYHDDGVTVITPTRTRSAGNFLEVLPRVNNDGTILVQIMPTVSEFLDENSTRTREILTQIIINNGDTLVLGGLNGSYQRTTRDGIPLTGVSVAKKESVPHQVVMFLTVVIDE